MYVVLDKLFFDTNQIVRQRAARYMKLFCKGFQKLRFAWDADFEQDTLLTLGGFQIILVQDQEFPVFPGFSAYRKTQERARRPEETCCQDFLSIKNH